MSSAPMGGLDRADYNSPRGLGLARWWSKDGAWHIALPETGREGFYYVPTAYSTRAEAIAAIEGTTAPTPGNQVSHTPGPWHVVKGNGEAEVFDATGAMVAVAMFPRTHPEARANARLIAAAPRMAKALQAAAAYVALVKATWPDSQEARELHDSLVATLAAAGVAS